MYSLMNPLCWSCFTLIKSKEQISLFSQCCLDKLQFHLTLDSNFNSFHRTTVNTSLGIQWLNFKARSVSQLFESFYLSLSLPIPRPVSPTPPPHTTTISTYTQCALPAFEWQAKSNRTVAHRVIIKIMKPCAYYYFYYWMCTCWFIKWNCKDN